MSEKEAYYFSHDSNARLDDKMIALRMKFGWEGYGIFWAIIEKLRECRDYMSVCDYNIIAYDLRSDSAKVKSIIEEFGLFAFAETENGKCFYSESLKKRMDKRSDTARKNAQKRWEKNAKSQQNDAPEMQSQCNGNATAMRNDANKGKERKGKKSKDIISSSTRTREDKGEVCQVGKKNETTATASVEFAKFTDIEQLLTKVFEDKNNFQRVFFQIGITDSEHLFEWMEAFNRFLKFNGVSKKTEMDYRKHFGNWIRTQDLQSSPVDYSPVKPKQNEQSNAKGTGFKNHGQSAGAVKLAQSLAKDLGIDQ